MLVAARVEKVTVESAYNITMVQSGWEADLALLGPSEKSYWRLILIRLTRSVSLQTLKHIMFYIYLHEHFYCKNRQKDVHADVDNFLQLQKMEKIKESVT